MRLMRQTRSNVNLFCRADRECAPGATSLVKLPAHFMGVESLAIRFEK